MIKTNKQYKYPNEPIRFSNDDIELFALWAAEQNVSDITIQTNEQIFCSIEGKLLRVTNRKMSPSEVIEIISSIYKNDGAITRLNGGSDVDFPWEIKNNKKRGELFRFRVNMTAILSNGARGYQITLRVIKSRPPLLENLNLPKEIINNLEKKQGLILMVGATGSGKSTLLASILDWRMRKLDANLKILTYEAPIEYVFDDVEKPSSIIAQTEIGVNLPSFSAGVRNALRRAPQVILVGEMRDRETIGEGITASMTGHLVYGTLHANGVADTPRRMITSFDVSEQNARAQDIISSIQLIVAQMLIIGIDGKRVAIREYLYFTNEMKEKLIEDGINNITHNIKEMLKSNGKTFAKDLKEKFKKGLIDKKTYDTTLKEISISEKDVEDDEWENL